MGWFWGSNSTATKPDNPPKAVKDLDPELRDYLKKQSPADYTSSAPTPAPEPRQKYADQLAALTPAPQAKSETGVPPQSLFPDGRYAHLWKTYTPLAEVEAAYKTEQEKILDIIDGYKERKAQIGRAALENCSLEQIAVSDCFRFGGWKSRMTMCRAESKKFENCYMMQARLLKALGYLSTYDRPPEVDEQIQMHADRLYHEMLEQEIEIEKAKEEGRPIPTSESPAKTRDSVLSPPLSITDIRPLAPMYETNTTPANLNPSAQKAIEKRLKGLSPIERELEEKAIAAEIAIGQQLSAQLDEERRKQDLGRERRKEKGQENVSDKITRWLRF